MSPIGSVSDLGDNQTVQHVFSSCCQTQTKMYHSAMKESVCTAGGLPIAQVVWSTMINKQTGCQSVPNNNGSLK